MKIEKLNNISFIKVTMMLLIVLYHSLLFFGGTWFTVIKVVYKSRFLYAIALWFNTFHIHTFAMASVYLFYYYKDKKNIAPLGLTICCPACVRWLNVYLIIYPLTPMQVCPIRWEATTRRPR